MTDNIRNISESELRRITGVPRSTRTSWVRKKVLIQPEKGPFQEEHAVEAGIFALVADKLEAAVAQAAWLDARDRVLAAALGGSPGEHERLDVLVNTQTAALAIIDDDTEIGEILRRDSGQAHVLIQIAWCVNKVREAYWRYARSDGGEGRRTATRSRKSA